MDQRITKARVRLLLDAPWFGSLAMHLRIEDCDTIPTFDVDGTVMRYNPTFAATLTDDELKAVLAHEVMHCAMLHPYRRANRDPKDWNIACDYAINGELQKAGFKLPADCLLDSTYNGLSAEGIYAARAKKPQPNGSGNGQGQGQGQGQPSASTGTVSDPAGNQGQSTGQGQGQPASGQCPDAGQNTGMSASDWQIATEQANAVSRAAGNMPGGLAETVKASQAMPEDWRAILREFVEYTVPKDYSWTSPNRRHVANGLYLPGITKENLGHIVIAVDTSGSIDAALLAVFAREMQAIVSESKPDKVTVLYCDTRVNRIDEFEQDDPIELTAVGRGGTRFSPVFEHVAGLEVPACLIYFTDLENPASEQLTEPDYPVLWCTGQNVTSNGRFGRTVRVSLQD